MWTVKCLACPVTAGAGVPVVGGRLLSGGGSVSDELDGDAVEQAVPSEAVAPGVLAWRTMSLSGSAKWILAWACVPNRVLRAVVGVTCRVEGLSRRADRTPRRGCSRFPGRWPWFRH